MNNKEQSKGELNKIIDQEKEQEKRLIAKDRLSRVYTHFKDDNKTFAMISAYRPENTKEENNRKTMLLFHDLVAMKLGVVKMEGGLSGNSAPVFERCYFIGNITKEQAIELCTKYNQSFVLFKDKDGLRYIDRNGNNISELSTDLDVDNDFAIEKMKDFFLRRLQENNQKDFVKNKDTFYIGIQNWNWGRHSMSEYDNVENSHKYTNICEI